MTKKYDVVALGALTVDMQIAADETHLAKYGLKKGLSNMVTTETADKIAAGLSPVYAPGGPGANVAAGIALRGGKAALIGKIANDTPGKFITKRFGEHGIEYTPVLTDNPATGTTVVMALTTPDKERTFAVAPGACTELAVEDVDASLIANAKITYLDSYLWFAGSSKDAVHHAAELAKQSGGKVALAINDADIVKNNRAEFLALATSHADIIVGDKGEFMALFGTTTLEETAEAVSKLGVIASITAGAKGAYVIENGVMTHIPVQKIDKAKIVDTNGAGDQFAAGFIYGLSQGLTAPEAGIMGSKWAGDVIQHFGAEPQLPKPSPSNIQNNQPAPPRPPLAA